jgi:hypothetical protein
VSLKIARMLAVNSGPLRRHSLRGPGTLLVHLAGGVSACFGGVTVDPPPVPVTDEPAEPLVPAVPDPLPVPVSPDVPVLPVLPAELPLPAEPVFPAGPLPAVPEFPPLPTSPGIAEPWPAQPEADRIAAKATRQGRCIRTSWEGQKAKRQSV